MLYSRYSYSIYHKQNLAKVLSLNISRNCGMKLAVSHAKTASFVKY